MNDLDALDPMNWVDAIIKLSSTGAFWAVVGLVAFAIAANAWAKSRRKGSE